VWALQRATTRNQSCRLHNSRRSLATGGYRRGNLDLYVGAETFPITLLTLNVRIKSVSTDTTSTNCILFEVKGFRIWHAVNDLSECADLSATRTEESTDPFVAFSGHGERVGAGADKNIVGASGSKRISYSSYWHYLWPTSATGI